MKTGKWRGQTMKTIQELAIKINQDRIKQLKQDYPTMREDMLLDTAQVFVVPGNKYIKIDVGPSCNPSGKLMIDTEGNIFGIKGYGKIHHGHCYGTLDTIDNYFWGNYYPVKVVSHE